MSNTKTRKTIARDQCKKFQEVKLLGDGSRLFFYSTIWKIISAVLNSYYQKVTCRTTKLSFW